MLQQILGSQARAEILNYLFTVEHKKFYLRELSRLAHLSAPVLLREIRQLSKLGLIFTEKDGNRLSISANTNNPLYNTLCELVQKTTGPEAIIREVFADTNAEFVFIFGSFARGQSTAISDLDIFIIGNIGLREVTHLLQSASEKINQEINPYVISKDEFIKRKNENDHFIKNIVSSPKIFLKGDSDEFRTMEI